MKPFWGRFVANVAGLIVIGALFKSVEFHGVWSFLFAALILGLVNAYIRPVAHILALPLTIATFGFFALIVNLFCLALVAWLTPGFDLHGWFWPMIAAIVLSIVSAIASQIIGVESDE